MKLIDLQKAVEHPVWKPVMRVIGTPLENLLAVTAVNRVYARLAHQGGDAGIQFFKRSLDQLNISYHVARSDLAKIPAEGPLVVLSNHPFGGVDGLILADTLSKVRTDVRILGNFLLHHIPEVRKFVIAVNPFQERATQATNAAAFRRAVRWVKNGGALIAFPAGEVASLNIVRRRICDPPWSPHIAALIRMAQAKVLPVFFPGRNSMLFHLLGLFHPRVRTILLPREIVTKNGRQLRLLIGRTLAWHKLQHLSSDTRRMAYLRFHTYFLQNRLISTRRRDTVAALGSRSYRRGTGLPIVQPLGESVLRRNLEALPRHQCLLQYKELGVFYCHQRQAPDIIHEIGRLREITFREVAEGTGRPIDIDPFDTYYLHLFLWNQQTAEVVGGYRLGLTDEILATFGPKGLYTNSLFRFRAAFVQQIQLAVELGRSFIRPDYQKKYWSLSLLWRGIGEFIVRNPQYRMLFGPVSISHQYHHISKTLMVEFLRQKKTATNLVQAVQARRPFHSPRNRSLPRLLKTSQSRQNDGLPLEDAEDISMLIAEIESDGKGIPVLIKHYLKLDGAFVGFNVDKRFSNVVDGLVIVDLLRTNPKILSRFMGSDGAAAFLSHHQNEDGGHRQSA